MIQMSYTKRALLVMAAVGLMSFTGCKIKTPFLYHHKGGLTLHRPAPKAGAPSLS